ncbi:MAG: HAMP domain-containing histidine kinase [Oscillospiraceae bacterium]|nr:HAMP domain-containing histidine kinase [Oscillospiraceae bacterium]
MHSIRVQLLAFITAVLLIFLVILNIFPLTSSRDLIFEEKRSAISGQAAVVASSLSGLDRLAPESVREVLRLLDLGGYSRTVVTGEDGTVVYDDAGTTGAVTDIADIRSSLGGKSVFRSHFTSEAFSSSCAVPVYSRGNMIGAVYLCEQDYERADLISDIQRSLMRISLIIGAVALLFAGVFTTVLLRRMRELVRSIRIVAGGDYAHRLETSGSDEITELGNEFNHLTARLEDTEKQRRRFVSDASHELKTPLASIRLLSDSIVQSGSMDGETMREFAADIGHEAERLQRTTEKLLDLSRLDDGVQVIPEPVDLKQVTVDALAVLNPLAAEKDVKIRCELSDGCVVMANTDDMFHIVFNLMENAVKYNVPGGSVQVRVNAEEDKILLTVADTGIGIPEEDRLNIFARFYRVDKARSRASGGSGLGLSIVHDAVLAHGGTIAVGQNKPQGSVFVVTFPRPTSEETGI